MRAAAAANAGVMTANSGKGAAPQLLIVLAAHGGSARGRQLMAVGVPAGALRRGLDHGVIIRAGAGLYAAPDAEPQLLQVRRLHALLTCASAAQHYGLWLLHEPDRLHVCAAHRRLPPTVAGHRWSPSIVEGRLPYARLKDVLVHALRCLPPMEALVMVESAVGHGDMDLNFLRNLLPGNRNAKYRAILDLVEPGADSLLETLARVLFRAAGIRTEAQVFLDGIGYVDFLLEDFLIVEIDGLTHLDKRQFKKDRRRDNRSVRDGYLVLRYLYEDVVYEPERMLKEIQQVLAGRVIR